MASLWSRVVRDGHNAMMGAIGSRKRVWQVDVMALFFGIGAWISINGMWVELPLLVQTLPEAWNLPSYMSVIIQMANVGPIAYSLLHTLRPTVVKETNSIYVVMTIGTISSLLLVFLWTQTTVVDGVQHSTALFVLLFFISLVDCSSSVLFMPFMGEYLLLILILSIERYSSMLNGEY